LRTVLILNFGFDEEHPDVPVVETQRRAADSDPPRQA
jgi:hypothetical protein